MKVLFLTKYPIQGASSRYRVYQYIPHLEKMGMVCDVSSFMSEAMYAAVFGRRERLKMFFYTAISIVKRISLLGIIHRYDLIYLQRDCLPIGGAWMEKWIAKRKPTIFDYDDALFVAQKSEVSNLATKLRRPEKFYDIFKCVDRVLAGNNWLAERAGEYNSRSFAFHVAEDTERIPMRASEINFEKIILGWMGSPSTEKHLELIRDVLGRLSHEYPNIELKVVGGGKFISDRINIEHVKWSLEKEVEMLCSFDIGLMPLLPQEWSKGKSGGKARTYMAAGVPAVVSKVGYNIELVNSNSIGRLAENQDDWYCMLKELINDKKLRENIGRNARDYVKREFSLIGQARKLLQHIEEVVKERHN